MFTPGLTTVMATWLSGLRLSEDYLTGYFGAAGRSDSAGGVDLYTTTRATFGGPFVDVQPLPGSGINTEEDESCPSVRGDGRLLVFERGPSGYGALHHLHYATRASTSSPFAYVGPLDGVNDPTAHDQNPFLREDGQVLYFASTRGSAATGFDIYRASWDGARFGAPVPVAELNATADDFSPIVTPDDRTIYFSSSRPGPDGSASQRVWMARRDSPDHPFSAPTIVGTFDVAGTESPTFVTRDQCVLYFAVYVVDTQYPYGLTFQYVAERTAR
jgi:hypothetical protein